MPRKKRIPVSPVLDIVADDFAGHPSAPAPSKEMDLNVELTIVKDFDIRPSKKAKCSESKFTISSVVSESINSESENELNDNPLPSTPSPTKSTLSPVFSELINEETVSTYEDKLPGEPVSVPTYEDKLPGEPVSTDDNKLPDEPTSTPSPTKSASPVSELMNEETLSEDEDKQIFSEHDNKLPDEPKHIINNLTYDYLPQDYTLTENDGCAHTVILYSKEDEILVRIDDISIKQRYLVCLLDEKEWLEDEVSTITNNEIASDY